MKSAFSRLSVATCLVTFTGPVLGETRNAAVGSSPMVIAQVLIGLAVVTALILLFAWLAKRIGYGGFMPQKNMRILGCLMLGNREKLVLVQVGDQQILLGVAPGRVSMLQSFDNPVVEVNGGEGRNQPSDTSHVPMSDFSRYLKEILKTGPGK